MNSVTLKNFKNLKEQVVQANSSIEDEETKNCGSGGKKEDSEDLAEDELMAVTKKAIKKHKQVRKAKKLAKR